jgi:hypothetical protein
MIQLTPFTEKNFERFISWVDNKELIDHNCRNYVFVFHLTADTRTYLDDEKSYSFKLSISDLKTRTIGHAGDIASQGIEILRLINV